MPENPFDPKQPRDARGRWTVGEAVTASREARSRTAHTMRTSATSVDHYHAGRAHRHAATGHRELGTRHGTIGNARASTMHGELAREHDEQAAQHEARFEASKRKPAEPPPRAPSAGPGLRKAPDVKRAIAARKGHEKRREREDFVVQNLPIELLPLWEREKRNFTRGTPHERYERFVEYAESHPEEAVEAMNDESERKLARLIAEHEGRGTRYDEVDPDIDFPFGALASNPGGAAMAKKKINPWTPNLSELEGWRHRINSILGLLGTASVNERREYVYRDETRTELVRAVFDLRAEIGLAEMRERDLAAAPPAGASAPAPEPAAVVVGETVVVNPAAPPSYRAAHWGVDAKSRRPLDIPDPRANRRKSPPMVGLGELVAVTYGTIKGGDGGEITNYTHTFESRRPVLCYGAVDGKLFIAGGSYHVSVRGIVG